ncbi:MAG: RNA 2',3'-cyclic phosphodiesterase [Chloroflexi bacterium]|nr:RNA 2',3'-cyclic phosphodiesterase [Chloroflexota bacterium]
MEKVPRRRLRQWRPEHSTALITAGDTFGVETSEKIASDAGPEMWRAFVALDLPEVIRRKLTALKYKMPPGPASALRWLEPHGIHLTIRFLGDIDPNRVPEISERLNLAALQSTPFMLELAATGIFPSSQRPNVFWVGLAGEIQRLSQFQGRVEGALSAAGFEPDERGFHPHLTIARISKRARPREARAAAEAFAKLTIEPGARFKVESLTFFRSHLLESGPRYEALSIAPLG